MKKRRQKCGTAVPNQVQGSPMKRELCIRDWKFILTGTAILSTKLLSMRKRLSLCV